MIRRLFVLGSVLVIPLLCCTGSVRAQCTGYSITATSVNLLSPTDAAKQGYTTATVTGKVTNATDSSGNDGDKSHKLTVTPGTAVTFAFSSNNASSGNLFYTVDNDPTQHYWSAALNGTYAVTFQQSTVGHIYHVEFASSNGPSATSQDNDDVTVVAGGGPSIVYQDSVPTNAYYQLVSTFGGGSMMNNCGECQGGETQPCLQATHTPLFDSTITNPRTGETYTLSNVSAGNVAKATESVSGTAYTPVVSVLPGDSPTGSTTNKIYCTMFGWVMAQQWSPGVPDLEWAITEVETIPSTCTLALRFFEQNSDWGVQCNVAWKKPPATADRCTAASQVPDFNPATVWDEQDCKIPGDCGTSDLPPPNGPNQNFPKFWYAASSGVRIGGPPSPGSPDPIINGGAHNWVFPIYLAKLYIPGGPDEDWWILDLLNIAVAKGTGLPIDCTNRDKGTSPITSPW